MLTTTSVALLVTLLERIVHLGHSLLQATNGGLVLHEAATGAARLLHNRSSITRNGLRGIGSSSG